MFVFSAGKAEKVLLFRHLIVLLADLPLVGLKIYQS
jgi:hypothetical protein